MLREVDRFDVRITDTGQIVKIIKLQQANECAKLFMYQVLGGAHVRPMDGVTFEIERPDRKTLVARENRVAGRV